MVQDSARIPLSTGLFELLRVPRDRLEEALAGALLGCKADAEETAEERFAILPPLSPGVLPGVPRSAASKARAGEASRLLTDLAYQASVRPYPVIADPGQSLITLAVPSDSIFWLEEVRVACRFWGTSEDLLGAESEVEVISGIRPRPLTEAQLEQLLHEVRVEAVFLGSGGDESTHELSVQGTTLVRWVGEPGAVLELRAQNQSELPWPAYLNLRVRGSRAPVKTVREEVDRLGYVASLIVELVQMPDPSEPGSWIAQSLTVNGDKTCLVQARVRGKDLLRLAQARAEGGDGYVYLRGASGKEESSARRKLRAFLEEKGLDPEQLLEIQRGRGIRLGPSPKIRKDKG